MSVFWVGQIGALLGILFASFRPRRSLRESG